MWKKIKKIIKRVIARCPRCHCEVRQSRTVAISNGIASSFSRSAGSLLAMTRKFRLAKKPSIILLFLLAFGLTASCFFLVGTDVLAVVDNQEVQPPAESQLFNYFFEPLGLQIVSKLVAEPENLDFSRLLPEEEVVKQATVSTDLITTPASVSAKPKPPVSIIEGEKETVYNISWSSGQSSVIANQTSLLHLTDKEPSLKSLSALRNLDFKNDSLKDLFDQQTIQLLENAYFPETDDQTVALIALNTLSVDEISMKRARQLTEWVNAAGSAAEKQQRLAVADQDPLLFKRAAALIGQKGKLTLIYPDKSEKEYQALVVDVAQTKHSFEMSGLIDPNEVGVGNQFIVDIVNPNFAKILGWQFDAAGDPYIASLSANRKIRIEVESLPEILYISPQEGRQFFFQEIIFKLKQFLSSIW